jgi:glycosyltransferase involved in cell wall biosynthesis
VRLALVISSLCSGGAERTISLLANHWAARGDRVCLVTVDGMASDCYVLHPDVNRIALGLLQNSNSVAAAVVNNWRRIRALRHVFAAAMPDVILSFQHETNVLVLFATRATPFRVVVAERTDPCMHPIERKWNVLRRLMYPLAHALVVQTNALVPWAQSIMRRGAIAVVPNPVRDVRAYARSDGLQAADVIVAVGRLVHEKGFDVLICAFARIVEHFPEATLVIVGQGPEHDSLSRLARELGMAERVILRGWMDEPGEALARARLFVMSSRYEGFPNALLEAMACGLPVISTAFKGAQEIITDGVDGILVPVGCAEALGAAIERLLMDPQLSARLAWSARSVALRFSIETIAKRWDAVFSDVRGDQVRSSESEPAGQR